jgi:hypothetical protein
MEPTIQKTIDLLLSHANHLERFKPGTGAKFRIYVGLEGWRTDNKTPKVELICEFNDANNDYQSVKGASFKAVVDEVNRRLGYSDKERLKLDEFERSLVALPAPAEDDGLEWDRR